MIDTTSADALPTIDDDQDRCIDDTGERDPNVGGPVEGAATYDTPREALASWLAAEPLMPNGDYQEIALPDGSYGYAHRPRPDIELVAVVHVVHRDGGWAVASFERTPC